MENMKKSTLETTGIVAIIGALIGFLVFAPVINFLFGMFGGWILMTFVGEKLALGLNTVFDTTRFASSQLPMICGTLAVVGSYFKSHQTNNNK